jgi:two-component system phosphate regulon sensor histidine kinase PhoR
VKFSPSGTTVRVIVEAASDALVVHVDDEGPGIPEQEQSRIFERFYRTEKGRSTPGTGLGLSIVKHIVNLHRGSVEVASPVPGTDKGTRFTLRLPISD